jgi:hypothetical protein
MTSAFIVGAAMACPGHARAEGKSEDVFLDEGNNDDFAEPTPMRDADARPAKDVEATAPKKSMDDEMEPVAGSSGKARKGASRRGDDVGQAAKSAAKDAEAAGGKPEEGADQAARPGEEAVPTADEGQAAPPTDDAKKTARGAKAKTKKVAKASAGGAKASGKGRFKTTASDCEMHADASAESAKVLDVAAGKKLWVEPAGEGWFKAFRKRGEGYLAASCFK